MNDNDKNNALINELHIANKKVAQLEKELGEFKKEDTSDSSEHKYKTILKNIEEFYYEIDLSGNLTFFNEQLSHIYGYSSDELMGMNNREYASPETSKKMYRDLNEIYKTGKPLKSVEYEIISKDGSFRTVEISSSLIQSETGEAIGFRGIGKDITNQKEKEKERELLLDQLQQAQKLEAIATLAGGIAHDFNNILMGVQGNISLILLKMDKTSITYERLKKIEDLIERGANLTQQLLGFAKSKNFSVNPVDINSVIENTAYLFERSKKNITVNRDLEKEIWTVDINQGAIEQVLLSLYVNAAQAMPNGGKLYIHSKNVILDESFVRPYRLKPGEYVLISVKDTGRGMDLATQKRIFDPFFTTKNIGQGSGLGLASVLGIVKNHGGIIKVDSEKGEGSVFNIYLIVSSRYTTTMVNKSKNITVGADTILLIDDDELIIDVCESLLTELGYQVITAINGRAALKKIKENFKAIKIIMLDITLPDMEGTEVLDRIKILNPEVPILLMSGYSRDEKINRIIHKSNNNFIQKPFNLKQLSEKLKAVGYK